VVHCRRARARVFGAGVRRERVARGSSRPERGGGLRRVPARVLGVGVCGATVARGLLQRARVARRSVFASLLQKKARVLGSAASCVVKASHVASRCGAPVYARQAIVFLSSRARPRVAIQRPRK
jgi:hypothetical protein